MNGIHRWGLFRNGERSDLIPPCNSAGEVAVSALLKNFTPAVDHLERWIKYNDLESSMEIITDGDGMRRVVSLDHDTVMRWKCHVTNIADEYGLEELGDGWTIREVRE